MCQCVGVSLHALGVEHIETGPWTVAGHAGRTASLRHDRTLVDGMQLALAA